MLLQQSIHCWRAQVRLKGFTDTDWAPVLFIIHWTGEMLTKLLIILEKNNSSSKWVLRAISIDNRKNPWQVQPVSRTMWKVTEASMKQRENGGFVWEHIWDTHCSWKSNIGGSKRIGLQFPRCGDVLRETGRCDSRNSRPGKTASMFVCISNKWEAKHTSRAAQCAPRLF